MIIDDIMKSLQVYERREALRTFSRVATFVTIEEVAALYYAEGWHRTPKPLPLPRCVSPWPSAWIEWTGRDSRGETRGQGAMVTCSDRGAENESRWRLEIVFFLAGLPEWVVAWEVEIAADGSMGEARWACKVEPNSQIEGFANEWLEVVLFAFNFCHAAGGGTRETRQAADFVKRTCRRKGWPITRYYEIQIPRVDDGTPSPKSDARRTYSPPSLHGRRGYFQDYREGPGLFGRFNWPRLIWRPRIKGVGDPGAGEVQKAYAIRPPR